jgi:hypothetical protein
VLAAAGIDTAALLQAYEAEQQNMQQQLLQALHVPGAAADAPAGAADVQTPASTTTGSSSSSSTGSGEAATSSVGEGRH